MTTRTLYYEDSHLTRFSAAVLSCVKGKQGWEILLDATAFYPEGGGQAGDTGILGGVRVLDTRERGDTIVHFCEGGLEVGATVEGVIDWEPRFLRMQQHTGEHIISGIVNRRYGYHNTGFHMGSDILTVDFDGMIPQEDLAAIEWEANQAVWQNIPLRCWIPAPGELPGVFYRTKRALPWPVRIVEVPGFDSCACCGTHVKATGEVGIIKIFSTMGFRGGTRMEMACGKAAFRLMNQAWEQNRQVSQAFSAQVTETGAAARRMNDLLAQQKYRISALEQEIFQNTAKDYAGRGDVLHFADGLEGTALRELADAIAGQCGGTAAVFTGSDSQGYAYCLVTHTGDLRQQGRELVKALSGRGGGRPSIQQGRVQAARSEIEAFFQ